MKELITNPLLGSARVLEGLFYSGAIVVEADTDARFYQMVSSGLDDNLDLHFVNADNKQTVPTILDIYREMGVRSAGIVDFDVLDDAAEFTKQLIAVGLRELNLTTAEEWQTKIARAIGQDPAENRLKRISAHLEPLAALLGENTGNAKLLRRVEGLLRGALDEGKVWKEAKKRGSDVLPREVQGDFRNLYLLCANHGLFINPCGELESMLTGQGIDYTTDTKSWTRRALTSLPKLQVDPNEYPWKLMVDVDKFLAGEIVT